MKKARVSIIGGASLTGEVLLKIILSHRYTRPSEIVSSNYANQKISDVFLNFKKITDIKFSDYLPEKIIKNSDVVFLCKSEIEKTVELYKLASGKDIKFIDLSGDFRLKDISLYKDWYGFEHRFPEMTEDAVYGLPEINHRKIKNARFVANPGCYPTAAILGLAPLLKTNFIDKNSIVVDAYSGISGAGRTPQERNLAVQVLENLFAYKVGTHQHIPEIEQELSYLAGEKIKITFVPHITSLKHGIFTTIYTKLNKKLKSSDLHNLYAKFYKDKPFIRIYSKDIYPEVQNVVGTNFCDIGFKIDERTETLIIISCIDNLIKGASGQAVQNMNIMLGIEEKEGLTGFV